MSATIRYLFHEDPTDYDDTTFAKRYAEAKWVWKSLVQPLHGIKSS